jgi:hypothetical protein
MWTSRVRAWPRGTQIGVAVALASLLAAGICWWRFWDRHYTRLLLESPSSGRCDRRLSRPVLDRSLSLGTSFLLAHQKPAGNFDYEYDWRERALSVEDNEVRQAGASWGIALLYQGAPRPELAQAVERSLAFFNDSSRRVKSGRCTAYPGNTEGATGTLALVALAHIEYLRAAKDLAPEKRESLERLLKEYLQTLVRNAHPSGLWYSSFDSRTCKPRGEPSPYSDGEALLALVKAAKYLGQVELLPTIMTAAAAGKKLNIDEALAANADSDTTKGYYQWSSMAFYELATSDFPDTRVYGDTLLRLADWMIDDHHVLTRLRNTGYAFEGLTHAYAWAKQRGDARMAKYACVIDIGLERLLGWQVGGPLANRYASAPSDAKGLGGVQNEAMSPGLRIDVAQHQMHATQLARDLLY